MLDVVSNEYKYNNFSCKEYQNTNAFFSIVMGLGNVAVTRMNQTWERLPSKSRKIFAEFESLIDPSRNHRAYRIALNKMNPPIKIGRASCRERV